MVLTKDNLYQRNGIKNPETEAHGFKTKVPLPLSGEMTVFNK